ncbi:hypothetical protein C7M84_019431 [Penaeus vannamei]|uniref:Uncharacterized protein n=1 Tax=Penaeus vannamei TaxID=6689 RepID=A0A423SES5_PENVA|nr:hypothetical protein C7M84_019431 [Penaeus vannamei]
MRVGLGEVLCAVSIANFQDGCRDERRQSHLAPLEESLAEGRKGGGEVRRGLRSPLHINTPRLGLDPRPSISISLLRTQAEATYLCPLCESSPPRPCLPAAIAPCLPATLLPCLAPAIPPSSPLPPYPQKLYTPWNGRHPRLARPLPCPPFPERAFRAKGLFVSPSSQTSSVGRELLPSVPPPFLRGLHPFILALLPPPHPSCFVSLFLRALLHLLRLFNLPSLHSLSPSQSSIHPSRLLLVSLPVFSSFFVLCLTLLPSLLPLLLLPGLLSSWSAVAFRSPFFPLTLGASSLRIPSSFNSPCLRSTDFAFKSPSAFPSAFSLLLALRGCPLRRRMLPVLYCVRLPFFSACLFHPFTLSDLTSQPLLCLFVTPCRLLCSPALLSLHPVWALFSLLLSSTTQFTIQVTLIAKWQ